MDGNVILNGNKLIAICNENEYTLEDYIPTNGTNDIYLTQIKLANVTSEQKLVSLTTSDNISYGIKDMYCSSDDTTTTDVNEGGMLYLYLPEGSRTITITANGKTYSGQVVTSSENNSITTLNEN